MTEIITTSKNMIDRLYNSITLLVGEKELTTENTMFIVAKLMQLVEKYPELHGEEKKKLIIYVIRLFAVDHLEGNTDLQVLTFIDTMLPSVIDTIVSVDRKKLIIKIKKGVKSFLSCFK